MRRVCLKHGVQPETLRLFVKNIILNIEKTENLKKDDPQFKVMKPCINAVKDLLLNGDIPKEEKKK